MCVQRKISTREKKTANVSAKKSLKSFQWLIECIFLKKLFYVPLIVSIVAISPFNSTHNRKKVILYFRRRRRRCRRRRNLSSSSCIFSFLPLLFYVNCTDAIALVVPVHFRQNLLNLDDSNQSAIYIFFYRNDSNRCKSENWSLSSLRLKIRFLFWKRETETKHWGKILKAGICAPDLGDRIKRHPFVPKAKQKKKDKK